jgi:hypothetical protein
VQAKRKTASRGVRIVPAFCHQYIPRASASFPTDGGPGVNPETTPVAQLSVLEGGAFDFAFFLFASQPQKPFIRPNSCSALIFSLSLQNTKFCRCNTYKKQGEGAGHCWPEITSRREFNPRVLAGSSRLPKLLGDSLLDRLCESFRRGRPSRVSRTARCHVRA